MKSPQDPIQLRRLGDIWVDICGQKQRNHCAKEPECGRFLCKFNHLKAVFSTTTKRCVNVTNTRNSSAMRTCESKKRRKQLGGREKQKSRKDAKRGSKIGLIIRKLLISPQSLIRQEA